MILNKNPHMRWSQSWMLISLCTYLEELNSKNEDSLCSGFANDR